MYTFRNLVLAVVTSGFGLLSAADPNLIKLIPQDANFIAGLHADQIKTSRFGQYVLDQLKEEDGKFSKFISVTGFDPRRDLTEIVVAAADSKTRGKVLVLAKGRFDSAKIRTFAESEGAGKLSYQGIDVLTGKKDNEGWLAFLDSSTAVAGFGDYVKAAIDRNKASGAMIDPKVANKITELGTRYDAWMITASLENLTSQIKPKLDGSPVKGQQLVQGMQSVFGGVRFGANIELMAEATMRSEKDATALADVLRFMSSMVQMNRENDPKAAEAAALLDRIEAKATGNQFRMLLTVPEDTLEKMVKPAAHRKRSGDVI